MKQSISNLKLAERGAIISISTYLILSAAKLATGHLLHSSSLVADGFNNVSDIIGNVALLIGIRMARQPADRDHRFGHWKIEDLASLVTSIIMFYVGFDVLRDTIQKIPVKDSLFKYNDRYKQLSYVEIEGKKIPITIQTGEVTGGNNVKFSVFEVKIPKEEVLEGLDEDENTIADYLNFRWVSHNPTLIKKSINLYGSGVDSSEYKFQYEYKNNFPIKTKLNIDNQIVTTMVYEYNK